MIKIIEKETQKVSFFDIVKHLINNLKKARIGMYFIPMNYSVDSYLDSLINKALDSGLVKITSVSDCYLALDCKDYTVAIWNSNKYYAWISSGGIVNKNTQEKYNWDDSRVKRRTMIRILNAMEEL